MEGVNSSRYSWYIVRTFVNAKTLSPSSTIKEKKDVYYPLVGGVAQVVESFPSKFGKPQVQTPVPPRERERTRERENEREIRC
jgi:hypothetical protein